MKKVCSIIAGGKKSFIKVDKNDFVIACDKGYKYCKKEGIEPDIVIGDFDSYKGKICGKSRIISLPKEKNDTDLMFVIKHALENKFEVINIYCALGGRLDHLLGNLQAALFAAKNNIQVNVFDDDNELHLLSNSSIKLERRKNFSISVLSLTNESENVCISGAKYPLKNYILKNSEPIGISNEWVDDIKISVGDGVVLVIMSKIK